MANAQEGISLVSIRFRRFKALADFRVQLGPVSILVGPNNSGKSTVISALRVLAATFQTARARNPTVQQELGSWVYGYSIPEEGLPVELRNVLTDYTGAEATVEFRFSNAGQITLRFPRDGGAFATAQVGDRSIRSASDFRASFPYQVVVVPVLGPVESDEPFVEEKTVRRNLATHRASRNFRSYWTHFPDSFETFNELLSTTWPGISMNPPETYLDEDETRVAMFCEEARITREVYSMGLGFQVWCQLLTHLVRAEGAQLIVVDEPEIYLHPDLQRQFMGLLRNAAPAVLLATHSSDLIAEADPHEIVAIDKRLRSARRLRSAADVPDVLRSIGSSQNVVLTQLARTRRLVFLEGEEFKILAVLARIAGLDRLATGSDFARYPYGGFPVAAAVAAIIDGVTEALGGSILCAGLFDHDFRSNEEVDEIVRTLGQSMKLVHIYRRKEIENYLLIPSALQRALETSLRERTRRTGRQTPQGPQDIYKILDEVTDPMRLDVLGQYVGRRLDYVRRSGVDPATVTAEMTAWFERSWADLDQRLEIVPGKRTLRDLNTWLQDKYDIGLTWRMIATSIRQSDLPQEMRAILTDLDRFATQVVE